MNSGIGMNQTYSKEARLITKYLLSTQVKKEEEALYANAMHVLDLKFSNYENALAHQMFQSSFKMSCIDAGLALKDPTNPVRRKIFTMLAILEASPRYTNYFLSKNFSFFYYFILFLVGVRAVFRALLGMLMIKNIQRRCP